MDKPISIAIRETKEKVIEVLNASGLTIDLMAYIMKDITSIVTAQAEAEYQQTLAEYNKEGKE